MKNSMGKLIYQLQKEITIGNKKKNYENSNIKFKENEKYNYKIICKGCKQEFYRQRLDKNFTRKFRCAKCDGRFEVIALV